MMHAIKSCRFQTDRCNNSTSGARMLEWDAPRDGVPVVILFRRTPRYFTTPEREAAANNFNSFQPHSQMTTESGPNWPLHSFRTFRTFSLFLLRSGQSLFSDICKFCNILMCIHYFSDTYFIY